VQKQKTYAIADRSRHAAAHTIRHGIYSNFVILKSKLEVTQGHWHWYLSKAAVSYLPSIVG